MRKTAIIMIMFFLIQSVSNAFVVRKADIKIEKTIPFCFISDTPFCEESIRIGDRDNVKIEKVYTDNGKVKSYVEGNNVFLDFSEGKKSNSVKIVKKTDVLELEGIPLTNETAKTINYSEIGNISEINEVSGDFESAEITSKGELKIKIKKDAKGIKGYDESKTVKTEINVAVDENNRLRNVESKYIKFEHEKIGTIKAKSGDTSNVYDIIESDKGIKIIFNNGIPKCNETVVNGGYTYCWIDRDENGNFKPYNPNSIYNTDKNKITGEGKYLNETQKDELGMTLSNKNWLDYCGAEINGVRYTYLFDKDRGVSSNLGKIVEDKEILIEEQAFNTEKYTVKFSDKGVTYIPEGKLYSMGELVKGTSGWGEIFPNWDTESAKSFYNQLTGKYETYVKHYKFFYGPKVKKAFGGYFTYPYNVTLEYDHYKPVDLYSGNIVYTYETDENVNGYLYNGWIKISYTENKDVNDYPPTAPYNIKSSTLLNKISWEPSEDDYTPQEELYYEMQMYNGFWEDSIFTGKGETEASNNENTDIRIRAVDETDQFSDWAYLSDNLIEIEGEVLPNIINSGGKINIYAKTKSLSEIVKVEANCEELGIKCELEKTSERIPKFLEMAYDLSADFLEEDEYICPSNSKYVHTLNGNFRSYKFTSKSKTNNSDLRIDFPRKIEFTENGTLFFANGNYLNTPLDFFSYRNDDFFVRMDNGIGIRNKVTGKDELLFSFVSDTARRNAGRRLIFVPVQKLIINTFNYDWYGYPIYEEIELEKTIAEKPIVMAWNTDNNITYIDIYIEDKLIYSYSVEREVLERYIEYVGYNTASKVLKEYICMSYGYATPDRKRVVSDWAKMVLEVIVRRDMKDFQWLGYKVNKNEYVEEGCVANYNNNPKVRNTYRMLFLDEYASAAAIKKYINLIKTTNLPIGKDNENVFGDDVLDHISDFEFRNISTNKDVSDGEYEVELTATDVDGKTGKTSVTITVKNDEKRMYPEYDELDVKAEINNIKIGRFFYKDGEGFLEELKKDNKNIDTNGFISAGETLGVSISAKNADFIKIDFEGNESIKKLDNLTKHFLIDTPEKNGKNVEKIEENYEKFPLTLYPVDINENGECEFKYFYVIPYKTEQTLQSWSTLKTDTLENIDTTKLFERILPAYKLKILLNEEEYEIKFDVFERWDTILNRDIRKFIANSKSKWEMRISK